MLAGESPAKVIVKEPFSYPLCVYEIVCIKRGGKAFERMQAKV